MERKTKVKDKTELSPTEQRKSGKADQVTMPVKKVGKAEGILTKKKEGRGLNTEIHPALLTSNLNFIREQQHNDNPYLSTLNKHTGYENKIHKRYQRGLSFFQKGEISSKISDERQVQREELERNRQFNEREKIRLEKEDKKRRIKIERGELPDLELGEDKYILKASSVPTVEWWDLPFLEEKSLQILDKYSMPYPNDEDFISDEGDVEEIHPSIRYIQHPVPIKVEEVKIKDKIYLTKKEQKKVRRNTRKLIRQEKEEKIKLGLEPKPLPKVKLSNMMNVFENNQNITDPTTWETTVKQQVNARMRKHEEENNERHELAVRRRKEERNSMLGNKNQTTTQLESCCKVFWFKNLRNPKIRYKLKTNAKQLDLKGFSIRLGDPGPGIIIVIGTEKSCKFFENLVLRRIKWSENFKDQNIENSERVVDQSGNRAEKVWEGYLKEHKFPRWFMRACANDDEFKGILEKFDAQNFIDINRIKCNL
ncbi:hypothetical protein NCAS_0A08110 [Naumovozyma castellii]|uniref:Uncharacterized protein n=1 Tax=Naumovozyma castellii TaxID=27288 RepID=G0V7C1_NAUCA|nr:hypothetical protein NCAS_0A08110 [Naumovozyma castellii CBS 4309]CCC67369.1 hypothetical protein NCAS_0A08110 [Naumovozyma castellii CBS 4309]